METAGDPDDRAAIAPHLRVLEQQKVIKARARAMSSAAVALNPLTREKSFQDLGKAQAILARIEQKLGPQQAQATGAADTLQWAHEWIRNTHEELRRTLGRELKQACEAAGLGFRIISREEPIELRMAPLSVIIDRDRGEAELRFARQPLRTCRAEAQAIIAAHRQVLREIDGPFAAEQFHERCHGAWRAARAAGGAKSPERVEILDFLTYLALQMQARKFRVQPIKKNYKDYSRAQFAFDVWRLRQAGKLNCGGLRLNFGVATGTTATQKSRVIYFEDDQGQGEYKLTIYFTRQPAESPT